MQGNSEEIGDIKTNIALLNQSMIQHSKDQAKSLEVQTSLVVKLGDVLMEMKERDLRDEALKEKILIMEERQKEANDFYRPIIERTKHTQEAWDKFKSAMLSNWGRLVSVAILVLIAMALGVDVSKYFKL